jgi:hypothetical protein
LDKSRGAWKADPHPRLRSATYGICGGSEGSGKAGVTLVLISACSDTLISVGDRAEVKDVRSTE